MSKSVCVVIGVGPGNGAALARHFAKENYTVALLARTTDYTAKLAKELGNARAYACDVADRTHVEKVFKQIQQELGEVEVMIYNAGSGAWGNVEEITPEMFETSWRVNSLGLLLASQRVIPAMKKKGHGSIIIIGATSSRRGNVKTAAFAPAKAAQRSLAESMARYLWPFGIHVALIIVDGIVDLPQTRKHMPDKPDNFFVKPEDVAATAYWLTQQPQSAWAFEVEARPYGEVW